MVLPDLHEKLTILQSGHTTGGSYPGIEPQTVAVSTTVTQADGSNLRGFSHLYVAVSCGALGTAMVVRLKASDTEGGTYTAVAGASSSVLATQDNEFLIFSVPLTDRTVGPWYKAEVQTGGGAVGNDVAVTLIGYSPISTIDYDTETVDQSW